MTLPITAPATARPAPKDAIALLKAEPVARMAARKEELLALVA